jgi:hypothetical protein
MLAIGEESAELVEKLAVLATILVSHRNDLQRRLGISAITTNEVNLAVLSGCKRIRARAQRSAQREGITVDKAFCHRFRRCGFDELLRYLQTKSDLAKRVRTSANWLSESRRELKLDAAVVKSAIALESF